VLPEKRMRNCPSKKEMLIEGHRAYQVGDAPGKGPTRLPAWPREAISGQETTFADRDPVPATLALDLLLGWRRMSDPRPAGAAQQLRLEQISLARLLFALLRRRFTGRIALKQAPLGGDARPTQRTVWFRGGMPVFTDWVSPQLVLGQLMIRDRLIDDGQLMAALQSMAERGGLLGETLVAQGVAEPGAVTKGLQRQCAAKIVEMFALHRGTVIVSATPYELSNDLLDVNVLELILAGVSAHYDGERIRAEMGSPIEERLGASAAFERYRAHFRFREDDVRALDAMSRGGVTLNKLETLAASPERAARLVFVLWTCQMLKVGSPGPSPSRTQSARPSSRPAQPSSRDPSPAPVRPDPAQQAAPSPAVVPDAPPQTRAEPGGSDDAFLAELAALEAKIEADANPFEMLGIPLTAGKKDIRRAFSDLSRAFHPDGLQARGLAHLRDRVSAAFAALSEAQLLLGDKDKREELRAAIERGEAPTKSSGSDAAAMARAAFESELIAKDADKLLRAGRFDRALEHYERAAALTPDEADFHAGIAWCRYNLGAKDTTAAKIAELQLAEITEANPKLARAHYFRGLVLMNLGRDKAAIDALTAAHQHDPRLIDAERQARILRMKTTGSHEAVRRDKPTVTSSRFGLKGLFGKK
jgi:tetratricopeptide (TPR) repeat protein